MPLPETSSGYESNSGPAHTFAQWLQIGLAFTLPLIIFGVDRALHFLLPERPGFVRRTWPADALIRHAARTRSSRSSPDAKKDLRKQMDDLQRMIEEAPRVAEEKTRRDRETLLQRASEGRNRLDVSMALQDKRYGEYASENRRPRALRKERREGRLLFIVLVIALSVAIVWIATHLPL